MSELESTSHVISGAGMASEVDAFLDEFEKSMRSHAGDPFADKETLEKLSRAYPSLTQSNGRTPKYNSPDGIEGAKAKSVDPEYNGYNLLEVAEPPYNLTKLVRLSEKSTPHYSATAAKVVNIAQLGYEFVESAKTRESMSDKNEAQKKKFTKRVTKHKHEVEDWMESLNDEESLEEVLTKVVMDYYYTGNGYIEIGRTATGRVGYIGHVHATTVRVRRARDGFVQIAGEKVTYFRPYGKKDIPNPLTNDNKPNEIIHLKNYSPLSGFYGVPEIVVALMSVAGTELASKYNLDYFHNKATPRYVVVTKGGNLSATSQKQIMEFFETGMKGANHRSLYVPLPADTTESKTSFEMKPVEAGIQEASFDKYIKKNDATILMAHRVPASKIGLAEGVSLAVARDADKTFKEQVIRPLQALIEKKINRVIHEETIVLDFKFNELSLTDEDTQSKIDERRLRNKVDLPNEIRARDGLPAYPGGDKPLDLSAKKASDAAADTRGNRQRDAERSAGATDSDGEGRQTQGEGRTAE